jgi:molybdenum cofactor cytidylyltransferase
VLAAGGGTRFDGDGHKLRAALRGKPVVEWALAAAFEAGLDATAVVVGAVDLAGIVPAGVEVIASPDWADGIARSLQAGVSWARATGHEAVVVGLGDQPFVTAAAWRAVAAVDAPIAVATYAGRRGNPVRLASSVWPLLPVDGDDGARALMRERPDLVREVACAGDPADIDTREDLEHWS